jgi:hypothetical protein
MRRIRVETLSPHHRIDRSATTCTQISASNYSTVASTPPFALMANRRSCGRGERGGLALGAPHLVPVEAPACATKEHAKWVRIEGAIKRAVRKWNNWGLTPSSLAAYAYGGEASSSSSRHRRRSPTPYLAEEKDAPPKKLA